MLAKLFPLLFILAGFGLIILVVVRVREGLASNAWVEVAAKVQSAEMGKTRKASTSYRYHAHITYQYEVQGVSYTGRQVGFAGQGSGSESHAKKMLSRYATGTTVKAYCDPTTPGNAVLIRGAGASEGALYLLGVVVLVPIVFVVIGSCRTLRKPPLRSAVS